jgi:hypothetical protein
VEDLRGVEEDKEEDSWFEGDSESDFDSRRVIFLMRSERSRSARCFRTAERPVDGEPEPVPVYDELGELDSVQYSYFIHKIIKE